MNTMNMNSILTKAIEESKMVTEQIQESDNTGSESIFQVADQCGLILLQ